MQEETNNGQLLDFALQTKEYENELKNKRENFTVQIRSKQRDDLLKRKRDIPITPITDNNGQNQRCIILLPPQWSIEQQTQLKDVIMQATTNSFKINDFQALYEHLHQGDIFQQHYAMVGIRKILSVEKNPPVQLVIDANTLPKLIELMTQFEYPHLQLESAWAVTNIASGTTQQTQAIIDKGGIPLITSLLLNPHPEIVEQAIWAIGNISGDCASFRDLILRCSGVANLSKILMTSTQRNFIKHGTWALSNLCRGKPLPEYSRVKECLPVMCKIIMNEQDQEVLTDAGWALSYLSDGDFTRIQNVIDTGVVPFILKHIHNVNLSLQVPMIRSLGNLATGNDQQTATLIKYGILQQIEPLLAHEKKVIKREACWTISNITAGCSNQIATVVQNAGMMEKIFQNCNESLEVQKEAFYAIRNAMIKCAQPELELLLKYGIIQLFTKMLKNSDFQFILDAISGLDIIMKKGEEMFGSYMPLMEKFIENGGQQIIEELQSHPKDEVYAESYNFIQKYFELNNLII